VDHFHLLVIALTVDCEDMPSSPLVTITRWRAGWRRPLMTAFSVRRKLKKKTTEVESYLRGFEAQDAGWSHVADAERFVTKTAYAGASSNR
jgi:hypothetical protein